MLRGTESLEWRTIEEDSQWVVHREVGLGVTLGEELAGERIHCGNGERLGHRQVTFEVEARTRLVPRLAGSPAGLILGGVALLDMTPGDLRLSQSQQLAVQELELGCLGADAGD